MRKYPVLGILTRCCVKDYQIPGTNNVIKKGTEVFIPVYALHMDEKYYENPEHFIPERFNNENLQTKNHPNISFNKEKSTWKNQVNRPYYPFGDGPRNCIGTRLGKMQTKVGLVLMLQKFRFELKVQRNNHKIEFDSKSFLLSPLHGIILRAFKRK